MKNGTQDRRNTEREIARIERQITRAKKWQFVRQLGRSPVTTNVKATTAYNPQLFEETFGPPEWRAGKKSVLLFWNFLCADGRRGFSMFAKVPNGRLSKEPEVQIATQENSFSFFNWATLRLNAVENAIEPPAFLGSGLSFISDVDHH